MSSAADSTDFVEQLRRALAGTGERPRPAARIELPLGLGRLITPKAMAAMRPSAVLVPVLLRDTPSVLMTRRSEALRNHSGQISFPGGRRDESDSDYAATALREAHEEVGLRPEAVELIGYLDDYPTMSGYRITPVVGLIQPPFEPVFDQGEVAETFELPLQEVLGPDRFARGLHERDGMQLQFFELTYGSYRIWGATAGILWELRQRVLEHG